MPCMAPSSSARFVIASSAPRLLALPRGPRRPELGVIANQGVSAMRRVFGLLTWIRRLCLREKLLKLHIRTLADMGFSSELLKQGVRAWPWRTPIDPAGDLGRIEFGRSLTEADYATAVTELEANSDADLKDLGLSRAGFPEAVRHGRPRAPGQRPQAA